MGGLSTDRCLSVGTTLWLVAAVGYVVAEGTAAHALHGYNYIIHYISGLGVPAISPLAPMMNTAFVVQGLFFPAAAVLVVRRSEIATAWPFLLLAGLTGAGNVLVGLIYGGTGATWHFVGAVLVIAGGSTSIISGALLFRYLGAARGYVRVSLGLGLVSLFAGTMLAVHALPVGLWERAGVYPILIWQALTAVYFLRSRRRTA